MLILSPTETGYRCADIMRVLNPMRSNFQRFLLIIISVALLSGCAEGMFWKSGYLSPWVRQKWSEEEQIAATLFSKRAEMRTKVDEAIAGGSDRQEKTSQYLSDIITNDPILLLRIEATRLLGELDTETALSALLIASKDREFEVRLASIRSLQNRSEDLAGQVLAGLASSDSNINVRIRATAALGRYDTAITKQVLADVIKDPNPAIQLRAAEALATMTGQDFGTDIRAWQEYLQETTLEEPSDSSRTAEQDSSDPLSSFR